MSLEEVFRAEGVRAKLEDAADSQTSYCSVWLGPDGKGWKVERNRQGTGL